MDDLSSASIISRHLITSDTTVKDTDSLDDIKLGTLRKAIPASCFQSSTTKSLLYVVRDLAYASILIYLAFQIEYLPSQLGRLCAWTIYSFAQGCVGTGIWILAHECGHGSFSSSTILNDTVGWTLHSLLLVPYFSWKYTHARHHRYTGHIEKDVVYVPEVEQDLIHEDPSLLHTLMHRAEETPIFTMLRLFRRQLLGWQIYLFSGVTSGKRSLGNNKGIAESGYQSHFLPSSQFFSKSQRIGVLLSDLGLALTFAGLYFAAQRIGWKLTLLLYVGPYLWVHHWLTAITYLHHSHPSVPYHTDATWTYTKGALGTIDRSCGFLGRHFFHDIIDHHVVHHLFPKIPFYKAEIATRAIQPLLGAHYHEEKKASFMWSLFSTYRMCKVVTEHKDSTPENPMPLHWKFASTPL